MSGLDFLKYLIAFHDQMAVNLNLSINL